MLVTTGLRDELPEVPGLAERWGIDVLHCPYGHDLTVIVGHDLTGIVGHDLTGIVGPLGEGWSIEVAGSRPRRDTHSMHARDVVVRARCR